MPIIKNSKHVWCYLPEVFINRYFWRKKKNKKNTPPLKKKDTKTKETYKLSFFFSLLSCEKLYFLKSKFVYDYCLCEKIWFQRIEISVKGSMYSHVLALDYKFIVEYIHKIIGKAFVVPQF